MNHRQTLRHFCLIQMQILTERETRLRKEILDCKIQKEYLTQVLSDVDENNTDTKLLQEIITTTKEKS